MLWATHLARHKHNSLVISSLVVLSLFVSFFGLQNTAHADTASWKDSKTISYGGSNYKGPTSGPVDMSDKYSYFSAKNARNCTAYIYFTSDYHTATTAKMIAPGFSMGQCSGYGDPVTVNFDKSLSGKPGAGSEDDGSTNGENSTAPPCDGGKLGWIICPAIDLMQNATNGAAQFLDGQLQIKGGISSANDSALYKVWQSILTVANILLVLAFLALILSQATSFGISNYGIKKLLPKIIAAAILMNLSYFICQVAVDFSNILGAGAGALVQAATDNKNIAQNLTDATSGFTSANVAGQVLIGSVAVAVILFFFLIPVLISVLVVVFVIAARLAIIYMLIMIVPLAFAAWVLPNTEKYFRKWWDLFINMLALYPMVMFVFGGAVVASHAILATNAAANTTDANDSQSIMTQLIALLVMVMPLFALPALFKASSSLLGRIHGMTQQKVKQYGGDAANNAFSKARQRKMQDVGAKMATNKWGKDADGNPIDGRGARFRRGLGRGASFVGGYNARRDFKHSQREISNKQLQQQGLADRLLDTDSGFAESAAGTAGAEGIERVRAQAIETVMRSGTEARENTEKMQQIFGRLSPFAAQAFASSVDDNGNFSKALLDQQMNDRYAKGEITADDVEELKRVQGFGGAFTSAAMSGAAGSLAASGFLNAEGGNENKFIRNAETAIRHSNLSEEEKEVSLARLADTINNGAKQNGMAQHMRWGVVGGQLIQNGQDVNLKGVQKMVDDGTAPASLASAYSDWASQSEGSPQKAAALGKLAKEFETHFQTPLGFQKVEAAEKISRKSFESKEGIDAFKKAMESDGFNDDAILTAANLRGKMSDQDRNALLKQAKAVVEDRGGNWETVVEEARERMSPFSRVTSERPTGATPTLGGTSTGGPAGTAPSPIVEPDDGSSTVPSSPAEGRGDEPPRGPEPPSSPPPPGSFFG